MFPSLNLRFDLAKLSETELVRRVDEAWRSYHAAEAKKQPWIELRNSWNGPIPIQWRTAFCRSSNVPISVPGLSPRQGFNGARLSTCTWHFAKSAISWMSLIAGLPGERRVRRNRHRGARPRLITQAADTAPAD